MIKLRVVVKHKSGLLRVNNKSRSKGSKWRKDLTYSLTVLLVSSNDSRFIDLRSIKCVDRFQG